MAGSALPTSALDRRILNIAVPSLFSLALDPLLAAVDTAFVGRLPGAENLAALGVSASLFSLVFSSFNFFGNAATPIIAEHAGRLGKAEACKLAGSIVAIAALLGLAALLCLEAIAPFFLELMGVHAHDDPILFATALGFIRVRALSAPAVVTQTALNGSLRALGDARSGLAAAVGAGCINLGLDLVFIFQLGLGVNGAAAATAVAEWCAVAFLAGRALSARADAMRGREWQLFSPASEVDSTMPPDQSEDRLGKPDSSAHGQVRPGSAQQHEQQASGLLEVLSPFFKASAATVLRTVALQLFFTSTTFNLGHSVANVDPAGAASIASAAANHASIALASHQLLLTIYMVLSFATDALAVAAQQIVASAQGVTDKRAAAWRVLQWGGAVGVVSAVALGAGAPAIVSAMAESQEVRAAAVPVLRRLGAPLQPLSALVFAGDGVLQGSLDFKFEAIAVGAAAAVGCAVLFGGGVLSFGEAHAPTSNAAGPVDGPPFALWLAWCAIAAVQLVRFLAFAWRYWASADGPLRSSSVAADGFNGVFSSDGAGTGAREAATTNTTNTPTEEI